MFDSVVFILKKTKSCIRVCDTGRCTIPDIPNQQ